MTAEETCTACGHALLTEWLIASRHWSPLHHLEILTPERTRGLLRSGRADIHFKPSSGDTPSPLERALQLAPGCPAASLVVRAAGPWSFAPHENFPDAQDESPARWLHKVHGRRIPKAGSQWALRVPSRHLWRPVESGMKTKDLADARSDAAQRGDNGRAFGEVAPQVLVGVDNCKPRGGAARQVGERLAVFNPLLASRVYLTHARGPFGIG